MNGVNLEASYEETPQCSPDPTMSSSFVALLMDSMARGIIFLDSRGLLTFMNRYAAELLRVRRESVLGKRVDMLPLRTPVYKVLSEQCRDVPLDMVLNGRIVAVQSAEIGLGDEDLRGEIIELWDVTEERRAKRQWEESVAMMTHDLKSPLTVMMGYIQGIRLGMYGEVRGRLRESVHKVEQSGTRLHAMIEDLLDTYRLEVGLLELNRQRCDIGGVLKKCCQDNRRTAQELGVRLVLKERGGLPELAVDEKQLTRVFNNLIGNAIKFTHGDGEVSIAAEITADTLQVSIADTGIGIPPEDLVRIFYKYYRSSGASGFRGTGLGLSISKTIMEAHGGRIEVTSTVGAGSTFTVVMPLCDTQDGHL